MTWYIFKGKRKEGPYSFQQLLEMIDSGHLKPDDLVWKPGRADWNKAIDIPGLFSPPTPPAQPVSHFQEENASINELSPPQEIGNPLFPAVSQHPAISNFSPLKIGNESYIFRHWHGTLPLPISYWVNGLLLSLVLFAVMRLIPWNDIVAEFPKLLSSAVIFLWNFTAIVTIWQFVGIWRSASNYIRQGNSKAWGNLARVAVVFGTISAVTQFVSSGIPQVIEFSQIAIGNDPLGTYQLRVLRDATELEISGPIVFGLTDDVRRTLDAHPSAHIIHLNSEGGRVAEARKLRDLIDSRGLTTFTASGCFSACTLAYIAGHKRLIGKNGVLGFHQYSFPGIKSHRFKSEYEIDKKDWLARGFSRTFVDKAFSTPNNEMWKPTHQELFKWGIVTGYPESDEVAISGFKIRDLENIEAELSKIPLYSALKKYEPTTYDRIISEIQSGLQKGRSMAELRQKIVPLCAVVYLQRLPYASDSALFSFTDLLLKQMKMLYAVDPSLCYDYVYGVEGRTNLDATKYFPKDLQEKEFLVMAEVIRSAAVQRHQPPNQKQIQKQLENVVASLSQKYGDDIKMLEDSKMAKANKAKASELTYEFYRTIHELPQSDAGVLLRFLFASANK